MAKYNEWLTKSGLLRLESWASDGLTNKDISENVGVSRQTFQDWLRDYPDMRDAINKGREPVIREVENAIFKNATGFEYEETSIEMWRDDKGVERQKVLRHKKYSKPDTGAAIFLLKNYKPEKYRNYNELTKHKMEAELEKVLMETKKIESEITSNDTLETKLDKLLSAIEEQVDNGLT